MKALFLILKILAKPNQNLNLQMLF